MILIPSLAIYANEKLEYFLYHESVHNQQSHLETPNRSMLSTDFYPLLI